MMIYKKFILHIKGRDGVYEVPGEWGEELDDGNEDDDDDGENILVDTDGYIDPSI